MNEPYLQIEVEVLWAKCRTCGVGFNPRSPEWIDQHRIHWCGGSLLGRIISPASMRDAEYWFDFYTLPANT